jgi:hypothetical protein
VIFGEKLEEDFKATDRWLPRHCIVYKELRKNTRKYIDSSAAENVLLNHQKLYFWHIIQKIQ